MPVEITEQYVRIRVKNPNLFVEGSFRTIDISVTEGIKAIIGKLKTDPQGSTQVQAYLFDKNKWNEQTAQAWVNEHKPKSLTELIYLYKEINLNYDEKDKRIKYFRPEIKNIDEQNHTVRAIFSTGVKDRDNEILPITSWDKRLKTYLEHNILVSSHNYRDLQNQIGEINNLTINKQDNKIEGDVKYYVGLGNKEADWGWILASKGKAMFSVGYYPHKILSGEEIPKEYKELEPKNVQPDNELLEISQVIIGSNRGALQMGIDNPDIEHNQYMYEIIKSFGKEIPEFETVEKNKTEQDIIISPIEIKNMVELQTIMEIWKTGRVLSTKNRELIQECMGHMQQSMDSLKQLIGMTEPKPDEMMTEPEKQILINSEVFELTEKANKILKSNL